jgi:hypothetical protein
MIWFLSVPNAATTTLIAKIELIFRIIPAAGLQTSHITASSQKLYSRPLLRGSKCHCYDGLIIHSIGDKKHCGFP